MAVPHLPIDPPSGFYEAHDEATERRLIEREVEDIPVLPHDVEAEAAVISAVLFEPEALLRVAGLRPEHFFSEAHRHIFAACLALADEGKPVDRILVATWLRDHGRLERAGGLEYLTQIIDATPAITNVEAHAAVVLEKATSRRRIELYEGAAARLLRGEPPEEVDASLQRQVATESPKPAPKIASLEDILGPAIARASRRAQGLEKPIPLPWPSLEEHFGGGLWPGAHFLVSLTGLGKTALCLQMGIHAARAGTPVLYIGLELEPMQVALRLLGDEAHAPWSKLYLGKAAPAHWTAVQAAVPKLMGLPMHFEFATPQGWPIAKLQEVTENVRAMYPEEEPGSRPMLVVLDYLQIIGSDVDPNGRTIELRERVGRASYICRELANRLNCAFLIISSTARDKYAVLGDACKAAGLAWDEDDAGRPINRRVLRPDAVVGLGKESGETEFAADSVSVMSRAGTQTKDSGTDVLFITAKGRATGATWSPMHFTGFAYREADDGGSFVVAAMREAEEGRASRREEAKQKERTERVDRDAKALMNFVGTHAGCTVREARTGAGLDHHPRWQAAVARLGPAFTRSTKDGCRIVPTLIPSELQ